MLLSKISIIFRKYFEADLFSFVTDPIHNRSVRGVIHLLYLSPGSAAPAPAAVPA